MMRFVWLRVALFCALLTLTFSGAAWAHVEVAPGEVRSGSEETFTVDVVGEKEVPAVEVRVGIPPGFEVLDAPTTEGWESGTEDGALVWSGGEIGEDRAAQFAFEARTPEEAGEFSWNGFVTYEDGSVVEWTGAPDSEYPASVVRVLSSGSGTSEDLPETGGMDAAALYAVGIGVLVLAAGAALMRRGSRTWR